MHFLETYLASILYVPLPFGIIASPGSTVLFTGKLMLLLLVYIREDAVVVRQPIYGLMLGNLLLLALAALMRLHGVGALAGHAADFGFLNEMGALMVWGTLILFVDCIVMILLYERLRGMLGNRLLPRLALTGALVLTFDQGAFFAGLHYLTGAPLSVLFGGWAAKMAAVAIYASSARSICAGWKRRAGATKPRRACATCSTADLSRALRGSDGSFGPRRADRRARPRPARTSAESASRKRRSPAGRSACSSRHRPFQELQRPLRAFRRRSRAAAHRPHRHGHRRHRRCRVPLRRRGIRGDRRRPDARGGAGAGRAHPPRRGEPMDADAGAPLVTVSIGLATCADDASDYDSLFECADRRLYLAKSAGRNCVIGETGIDPGAPKVAWAG